MRLRSSRFHGQLHRTCAIWLLAASVFGCSKSEPQGKSAEPATGAFAETASPASVGSGEPSLTVAPDGRLGMSWFEARRTGGHALLWSWLDGDSWTSPSTIAEGDSFFVNWADFPSVFATGDRLLAHWPWKNGRGTYSYEIRVSVSEDGGRTWSRPMVPHMDGTPTEHGFVSGAVEDGGVRLAWLDGRAGEGLSEEDPRRNMQLRTALVEDAGTVREDKLLDERVCDCCATASVSTPSGALVAYRDRTSDEVRDISLVRRRGGAWSEPATVFPDGWRIAGCPVNGPALDASLEHVALAWYTAAGDTPRVYCALSADGGESFGPRHRIDDGTPLGRVDVICLGDGSALVTWLEARGDSAEVSIRRLRPDGIGPRLVAAATSPARKSGFPRSVRAGKKVFLAWTDVSDSSRVRVVKADVWALASAQP